jgi:hypothetical protein
VETSELRLLEVIQGCLRAEVGHLEGRKREKKEKKYHLFTFLNLLARCAACTKTEVFYLALPLNYGWLFHAIEGLWR